MRYHDSVRPVAVGLVLQSHGAEGAGDVALRGGRRQRGAPDVAHLGGDEKRQHTLTRGNNKTKLVPQIHNMPVRDVPGHSGTSKGECGSPGR